MWESAMSPVTCLGAYVGAGIQRKPLCADFRESALESIRPSKREIATPD